MEYNPLQMFKRNFCYHQLHGFFVETNLTTTQLLTPKIRFHPPLITTEKKIPAVDMSYLSLRSLNPYLCARAVNIFRIPLVLNFALFCFAEG